MARQERAIRTRRLVLEAAAEVFAQQGYESATISEILERAGVTKGALYFHFGSKEELARGVLEHAVTEAVPEQPSILQTFVDTALVLAHRLPREPLLRASARLAADQGAQEFFGQAWLGWVDVTEQLFIEAKKKGEVLQHIDPRATSEMLTASFTGVQMFSQAHFEMKDLPERVSVMFSLVLPAVATPAVLAQLDSSPRRGAEVAAEMRTRALANEHAQQVAESA